MSANEKLTNMDWDLLLCKLIKIYGEKLSEVSNEDIFKYCLEPNNFRYVAEYFLDSVKKSNLKNSALAIEKKEEGNKKFKNVEYEESLSLYTESIFYAAKDDECLPLSYSNRSMVLERLGYLSESILDIDMALDCGYPKNKEEILILRKARCFSKMGNITKAKEILTEALKNCKEKENQKIIENELKKIKNSKDKEISCSEFKLPEITGGENENFPSASKYLSVYYDEIRGRHVVANHDIKPKDILLVEKPFVFKTFNKFCGYCCKKSVAPFPCWNCRDAYYCSPKCRDNSWDSFHSFECGYTELLYSVGIGHLSLRIILKASSCLDELKKILKNISKPVYENGSIVHISKGYEGVFNAAVLDFEKITKSDMLQYAMTALLLALYLKNFTNYFPPDSNDGDLCLLSSVILRHILQTICNGFCISESFYVLSQERLTGKSENDFIGTAVYISSSILNHSCTPSAFLSFCKNYIIITAEKPIKKGEEVLISYLGNTKTMTKSERQKILRKQYLFDCKCSDCCKKFDILEKFQAYKCNKCKGPSILTDKNSVTTICLSCGQNSEVTPDIAEKRCKFYSLMKEGEVALGSENIALSLEKYLKAWRIGREIFYKFHADVTQAADEVAACLLELNELKKSIMFLKCCAQSTEERFGFLSIETANYLKKLADTITVFVIRNENAEDAKDLAQKGMLYYEKIKTIIEHFPEFEDFKDLEANMTILQMLLKKL